MIARIEEVHTSRIEKINQNQYLQYQGQKLRLVFLEDYLPVMKPERSVKDKIRVMIPKMMNCPVGIVIHNVIGTTTQAVKLDTTSISSPGLFGSAVVEGKITLFPDMYRLFDLAVPAKQKEDDVKSSGGRKKPRVMLVDDTAFFRMVESEYLSSAGYEVVQVENGKKALEILEQQKVDAVLLDIMMPEMDGWEVIRAIRADDRWKQLPVMSLTSLADEEMQKKGVEAGFTDWEEKLNKERLLDKLSGMIKG